MLFPLSKSQLLLAWSAVFAAGALVGGWWHRRMRDSWLDDLRADAVRCSLAFDPEKTAALSGTHEDLERTNYAQTRERLVTLQAVHPSVRLVSILRNVSSSPRVVFLAASDRDGSQDRFRPGDELPEEAQTSGLRSILRDGRALAEGPSQRSTGPVVSGYAQIGESRSTEGGLIRDVVALDLDGGSWRSGLWDETGHAALYVWLVLGIPLGVLTLRGRYSRRDALIQTLSQAVQQSQSGIMITSRDGRIEFVNAGLCRQLGYTSAELVGRACAEFEIPSLPASLVREMLVEIRAGRSWEGEWLARRKNGETYAVRGVVSPVRGPAEAHLGFIAVMNDMSSHQRHQEELRIAKEQAEAGDRAKGQFLATMSHEVRTPVHGIVGFTNLLLDTPLTPEQRDYVQTIRSSGEALVQLTGDILDFSRIESGGVQLEDSACNLRTTVEDALDIFAARAAERGVELLHWIEPDVPTQVILDGGRLRQVLVNLIGNGIKFTPVGEVEVTVRVLTGKAASIAPFDLTQATGQMVAELDDGSLTLEFAVRDTGIGIAAVDRSKLFQPFTQLDASSVRRYGGAGLGLAISRNLVRLMSGDIWLESEPGRGSTFYFTVRGRPPPRSEAAVAPAIQLNGLRVVIAAAMPRLRTELEALLRNAGAVVTTSSLPKLLDEPWDFAIVECAEVVIPELHTQAHRPEWRADRVFGLLSVTVTSAERQALRPHLRMMLNKPVHHRTLLDLLARAEKGARVEPAK